MKRFALLLFTMFSTILIFPQSLVAHYPLNGNTNDLSGNNNTGTIIGGVTPTTDRFGNPNSAMQFNGIDGYIEVPNSPSLQSPTNAITMAGWIYIESFPTNQVAVAGFINKTNNPSYGQYGLNYHHWATPSAIHFYGSGGTLGYGAPIDLQIGEWYFMASTYDGNEVNIYLNGQIIGTQAVTGSIVPDDNPLTLGLDTPGDTEYLHGKLDDVRIYNRALSQQEILERYTNDTTTVNVEPNSSNNIAINYKLFQNYPNPFNPITTIQYSLVERGFVSLKIFDVLGNEITTLVNEEKPSGTYTINFNASSLSSAIYFYTLKAGQYVMTKKMILIK